MTSSRLARWFSRRTFGLWQRLGLHVVPNHYYAPVPDTTTLPEALWRDRDTVAGIDLQEDQQRARIERLAGFSSEFDQLAAKTGPAPGYRPDNPSLLPADASAYYGLIRERGPKRIVEIGGGFSSLVARAAMQHNAKQSGVAGELTVIEPYPPDWLSSSADINLVQQPVQEVAMAQFESLQEGDILFIDSSHVLTVGSDVQYEVLEILPRLARGVLVHVHDIFIPNEYPKEWIKNQKRFWTEQYILQAFLSGNRSFSVVLALNFLARRSPEILKKLTSYHQPEHQPGSFWFERIA